MAVCSWLAELEQERSELDLDGCSTAQLTELGMVVAKGRRLLAAYATDVARAAAVGSGPAPEDVAEGKPRDRKGRGASGGEEGPKLTRRARALAELPALKAVFDAGSVRVETIDVVVKILADLQVDTRVLFVASDTDIAGAAKEAEPGGFRRWLQSHLNQLHERAGMDRLEAQQSASSLRVGTRGDGVGYLNGTLDPVRYEEVMARVRPLAVGLANQRGVPVSDRLQIEALHLLITHAPDLLATITGSEGPTPRHEISPKADTRTASATGEAGLGWRPLSIGVITDLATLAHGTHGGTVAETWRGQALPGQIISQLACDADLFQVLLGADGRPLDAGFTARQATPAQRLLLRSWYPVCPLSGEPFEWCEIHHVIPWPDQGPTDINNLVPLSKTWHGRLHHGGWTLELLPDRTIELYRPDGTHDRSVNPPVPLTRQPRGDP
ncbi:MAG: DUF222 domain-containing protein [Actinomycetia bacterium]|nr:DUF222 domain-containing protein [Actinomycetes bacterium]